jgi:prepilin-type N-terminal cleavage/methylation domain-containing protein
VSFDKHDAGPNMKLKIFRRDRQDGFSLVELLMAVVIILILTGAAVPSLLTAMRQARLRGASSDYAGLLEEARILAIRDNRYYSVRIIAGTGTAQASQVYVDMLPKSLTGASGNGGTSVAVGDPEVTMSTDVVLQAVASAPGTSSLQSLFVPAPTPVTQTDDRLRAPTVGPRGLPCTPVTFSGSPGGTICDSSGGPTAFWTFFKNTKSSTWQAVTITPAGRIQKWFYSGSTWSKL